VQNGKALSKRLNIFILCIHIVGMRVVLRSDDFEEQEISEQTIANTLGISNPEPDDTHVRMFITKRVHQQNIRSDRMWSAGVFSDDNRLLYTRRPVTTTEE
jgi:hypothetical protein